MDKKFTLIELLVVIGIIAILLSILSPSLSSARSKARRAVCLSQQRGTGQLLQGWIMDNDGLLPAAYDFNLVVPEMGGRNWKYIIEEKQVLHCPEVNIPDQLKNYSHFSLFANASWKRRKVTEIVDSSRFILTVDGFILSKNSAQSGLWKYGSSSSLGDPDDVATFPLNESGSIEIRHQRHINTSFADGHVIPLTRQGLLKRYFHFNPSS